MPPVMSNFMSNFMFNRPIGLIKILLLSGMAAGLVSCEALKSLRSEIASSPADTASSPADAASSGTANDAGSTKAIVGQTVSCDTPNYTGKITWEGDSPRITFGKKPNQTALNTASPVALLSNADGSTTYGYQGETTVYLRAYGDGRCLLQSLNGNGSVTVEEFGRTSFVNQVSVSPGSSSPTSSSPTSSSPVSASPGSNTLTAEQPIASPASPTNPAPAVPLSNPANAAEQPVGQPAGALLSCPGTIKDTVDFTAYFAPEAGFNRVVFRPRESKVVAVSVLSYSGKNGQGQDTWHGKANQVAAVTLVHLATAVPQRGDRISVDYDGLLGQGVCQ